jgi:hypothetical protein
VLKHQIGLDYSNIISDRKNKRELPFVLKLKKKIDIDKLKTQLHNYLLDINNSQNFLYDKASSEHNYDLSNTKGEHFVLNYEEIYKTYAKIGLQSLSDDALHLANSLEKNVSEYSPYERAKGMKNTSTKFYHPYYDERNYTKPTEFYKGYIKEFLESFKDEPCRSAIVSLEPGKFLSPHFDIGPEYITRLQIPIITNKKAVMGFRKDNDWFEYHFPADGSIYFVNSGWEHYAVNNGDQNRYQLRVCLNGQQELEDAEEVLPNSIFSHEMFSTRVESGNYYGNNLNNLMSDALTELGFNAENYSKYASAKI